MDNKWKTTSKENPAVMSENFEEFLHKEDDKFNNIMSLEELETFDITSTNVTQSFSTYNDCETISNKAMSGTNIADSQFSESDEEPFVEDIWDDFELDKPIKLKLVNNFGDKISKKKLSKRHKALVRYKTRPVVEFDEQTKYLLCRIMDKKYVSHYSHIIGTGSSSIVIYGNCARWVFMRLPWEVVVKVYKNDENSEALYEKVQNEFRSIYRISRCHIACPAPICAWRNIIVMGSIGYGKTALSVTEDPIEMKVTKYFGVIDSMRTMYQFAKIVHGNLSSRTILSYDARPTFIGLSHSVPAEHPEALNLLMRDCYSVTNLFHFLPEVKSAEELFKFVTDLPEIDDNLLELLRNMKESDIESDSKSYNSKYGTGKPSVDYSSILEFCTKLNRR